MKAVDKWFRRRDGDKESLKAFDVGHKFFVHRTTWANKPKWTLALDTPKDGLIIVAWRDTRDDAVALAERLMRHHADFVEAAQRVRTGWHRDKSARRHIPNGLSKLKWDTAKQLCKAG